LDILGPDVLDSSSPFSSKEVEPKAVMLGLDLTDEPESKLGPLRRVHEALEDRALHALTEILADLGDFSKPLFAVIRLRYVVAHDDHHALLPKEGRISVEIAANVPCKQQGLGMYRDSYVHLFANKGMFERFLFALLIFGDNDLPSLII
jgi:hypothetical protein